MTASPATDPSTFLAALDFNAATLQQMRGELHRSREARDGVNSELSGTTPAASGAEALRRGTCLFLLSRPAETLTALERADNGPQTTLLRGLAALEASDPATAVQSLSSLVGTEVEEVQFLTHLATAAALAGDANLAHNAAAKLPDGADALYAEGIALEAEGEYVESRRKYEEALARDPEHPRSLFRLALRLDTEGDDLQAIEMYRRCVALTPTNVNALLNVALLYEDAARYPDAESCYRRILASDPNHVRAQIGLKDVIASQNMYYDEDHERREDRRAQVLRTPISEFELSVRSRNCLAKMNLITLGDLVRKTEPELLAYKNFGETSLQEIKDILAQKGLRLGMTSDDDAPLFGGPTGATRASAEAQLDALFGGVGGMDIGTSGGNTEPDEIPIESLDLSIRARRCMDNLEIRTVADLMQHTEAELLASKNFGQTSLNEVRRKLETLGFTLRRK